MANISSAQKRIRTAEKKHARNRAATSKAASEKKKLDEALASGDAERSREQLRSYSAVLDRNVKKGSLKAGTASRRKSRAAAKVAAVSEQG
jgi:small subunit ribosomal protein S20